MTAQVGNSNSRGSVRLGLFGKLVVDVNYLETPDDVEALGAVTRIAAEIIRNRTGASAGQVPCGDNPTANCAAFDCPTIVQESTSLLNDLVKVFKPKCYDSLPPGPPSIITPDYVEKILTETGGNDKEAGERLREAVSAGNHYAGTAAIGKVIDNKFKVFGVDGLYVSDASALPQTSRVNIMATVMMLGRLVGLSTVSDDIARDASASA
jgi:choline dehydrogenase-like flavoprotein